MNSCFDLETPHSDPAPAQERFGRAMEYQLAGRLDLAEQIYRDVLRERRWDAMANHCLGMLLVQRRRAPDALPHLLTALRMSPAQPDFWLGYLETLLLERQYEEAEAMLALARQRGLGEAASADFAARLESAKRTLRAAEDELLEAMKRGNPALALARARALTETHAGRGLGWKVLGALLYADGRTDEALAAMERSVSLLPRDAEAHVNFGLSLAKLKRFDEAEKYLSEAIRIDPDFANAHYRLGMTYAMQARLAEAEASLRRGLAVRKAYAPQDDEQNHSNLLFILSHDAALGAADLFAEHLRYADHVEGPLRATWPRHGNDRNPLRRLNIGFVSGDLREHAVAGFIEPIVARLHGRPGLALSAYYNHDAEDAVSRRLRGCFDAWNSVCAATDERLAQQIMRDRIDILVDLSGHTAMNRLPVFARKPAPVQVSWIGYPGTTGLQAMDYYLADPHFLPPGEFDRCFTEKLVHLPANGSFQPYAAAPEPGPLPALENGHLRFGSFNRPDKINDASLRLWARLLRAVPDATMLIGAIDTSASARGLADRLGAYGISPARLEFHARCGTDEYLGLHRGVDLCLDTTPYGGGTTTYNALWMGVPTLTLAGETPASRGGAGVLGQVGLHEFIAHDTAQFVSKGVYWARNPAALAQLRANARALWRQARGGNAEAAADMIEAALRRMWRRWCAALPPETFQLDAAESHT